MTLKLKAWKNSIPRFFLTLGLVAGAGSLEWGVKSALGVEPSANASHRLPVYVQDRVVTLEVRDVPLSEALTALGEEAGFDVVVNGETEGQIEESFSAVPLEDVLRHLLGSRSFVMIDGSSGHRSRLIVLSDVKGTDPNATRSSQVDVPLVVESTPDEMKSWILDRLDRPDRDVRIVAVRRLTRLPPDVAVDLAAKVLRGERDPVVRGQAVLTLGRIGGIKAASLLDEVVEGDDSAAQIQAIRAMAELDDELAAHSLGRVAADHPDQQARLQATEALGENPSDTARYYLRSASEASDRAVQAAARTALARRRTAGASADVDSSLAYRQ